MSCTLIPPRRVAPQSLPAVPVDWVTLLRKEMVDHPDLDQTSRRQADRLRSTEAAAA
jgi:hypothetical protein